MAAVAGLENAALAVGTTTAAAGPTGGTGNLQVLVADADDRQDRAAAIGFDNRIDARIEPGADQRFHAGQGQFLELGIRQIDDFGHEVARRAPGRGLPR